MSEYWIIDPDESRATFLRLRGDHFEAVTPVRHIIRSTVLPGFSFDIRWLWASPRPVTFDVLGRLLHGRGRRSKRKSPAPRRGKKKAD